MIMVHTANDTKMKCASPRTCRFQSKEPSQKLLLKLKHKFFQEMNMH